MRRKLILITLRTCRNGKLILDTFIVALFNFEVPHPIQGGPATDHSRPRGVHHRQQPSAFRQGASFVGDFVMERRSIRNGVTLELEN